MTNHPIAIAVEPLREDAKARARKAAENTVQQVKEGLKAHGGDRRLLAPYPPGSVGKKAFMQMASYYRLVRLLTEVDPKAHSYRGINDPDPAVMSAKGIREFIANAEKDADAQYSAFIAKLIAKIGECDSAILDGSHVWGYSTLTIQKGSTIERWRTQMIINVSKLGKMFNQFPTRKVKN